MTYGLCEDCIKRHENHCILIGGVDELTGKEILLHKEPYHVQQCGKYAKSEVAVRCMIPGCVNTARWISVDGMALCNLHHKDAEPDAYVPFQSEVAGEKET